MDKILKYLLYILILTILIGPLGKISLSNGVNIYPNDFVVAVITIWVIWEIRKVREILQNNVVKYFYLFAGAALISFLLSPLSLNLNESLIAFLFLFRFIAYFNIFIAVRYLIYKKQIAGINIGKLLGVSGVIIAFIGWLQYFLYPDLRNLYYLGWDPHYKRIFATYLDPNFFGLIMVLSAITIFYFYKGMVKWAGLFFTIATLAFTYSRGSYLAFLASLFFYSILIRKIRITVITVITFITLIFLLPRPSGNESVKLERIFTINERISNWNKALSLSLKYPLLGIGFNTLKYARLESGQTRSQYDDHAITGVDNSFLFVLVTTGFIGLVFFIIFMLNLFLSMDQGGKIILSAILVHSFFTNSFFFPFAMIWMWIIAGIRGYKKL